MLFQIIESGEVIGEEWIDLEDENQIRDLFIEYFDCDEFVVSKDGNETVINLDYENYMINRS